MFDARTPLGGNGPHPRSRAVKKVTVAMRNMLMILTGDYKKYEASAKPDVS